MEMKKQCSLKEIKESKNTKLCTFPLTSKVVGRKEKKNQCSLMGMYQIFNIKKRNFEFQHSVLGKWLWVSPIVFLIVHFLACNACVTELFREVNELMDCEIILWARKHFWSLFSLHFYCYVFIICYSISHVVL